MYYINDENLLIDLAVHKMSFFQGVFIVKR